MIISLDKNQKELRPNMRNGVGTVQLTHLIQKEQLANIRLFAKLEIPVGGSIGEHEHLSETEFI